MTRRDFLRRLGIGAAALAIAPATRLLGDPAKIRAAAVGTERKRLYGGKLTENLIQAQARTIFFSPQDYHGEVLWSYPQDPTSFRINPEWENAPYEVVFAVTRQEDVERLVSCFLPVPTEPGSTRPSGRSRNSSAHDCTRTQGSEGIHRRPGRGAPLR